MESATAPGETGRLEISAVADAPATERLRATTTPMRPVVPARVGARRFSWQAIAGTAAVVFVLALLLIAAVELISGKPLSAIFGHAGGGTTVGQRRQPTAGCEHHDHHDAVDDHVDDQLVDELVHLLAEQHDEHDRAHEQLEQLEQLHHLDHAGSLDDDHLAGFVVIDLDDSGRNRYQPLKSAGRRSTKLAMPSVESWWW